ncbi:hypothetical protein [Streptomyces liliifuscus]|uniref:Uncharacterized protein n=1 Tax=Streptomyces liliifuscus TaxID=2797636 RepID=A0A7T7HZM0_9ACTN|nr:hypothetical protein [Streptomyces liliifuscus]QQM38304.1 hypothetical protein JEQ17_01615 [Streptomyces liliifuscus]
MAPRNDPDNTALPASLNAWLALAQVLTGLCCSPSRTTAIVQPSSFSATSKTPACQTMAAQLLGNSVSFTT